MQRNSAWGAGAAAPRLSGSRRRYGLSSQPGGEQRLDLDATAWSLEARLDPLAVDDEERGRLRDAETLRQIQPRLPVDAIRRERRLVVAPLQHLSEEPFDAAAATAARRVEEEQPRPGNPRGGRAPSKNRRLAAHERRGSPGNATPSTPTATERGA